MPFAIESKRFGLKKEAVRLTAEVTPDVWIAVEPDSEFEYKLEHIDDAGLRGIKSPFPSFPGLKTLTGSIKLPARARNIGEFFQMLLGNPTSVQQGATAAYKHTFLPPTSIQPPTFTFFVDRNMSIKKYNGVACKKISLTGPVDGAVMLEAELLGLSEAAGAIGVPVFTESEMLEFFHATVKVGGVANTDIRSWALSIDNALFAKRVLAQSQDARDVLAAGRVEAEGSFVIYFESDTERDKFIANTTNSIEFLIEGNTADGAFKNTLDVLFPKIHYKAYPYGESEGLLAAEVEFRAVYDTATSKQLEAYIINTKTSY